MTLIIDGYNLLHASGVFGEERGPRGLEASRTALLDELADLLGDGSEDAIVVFDAARAPEGLPDRHTHRGLKVLFARDHPEADALIEELVAADGAPASLTVVSSDRRLQVAARRRRARAVPSDEWLAEMRRRRRAAGRRPEDKPAPPSTAEVDDWKRYFGY
jgi:predicted RNA-binding protein with PIN domain